MKRESIFLCDFFVRHSLLLKDRPVF